MSNISAFIIGEAKESINQWLGIAFIGLLCFWTVLYWVVQKTQAVGQTYAADTTYALHNAELRAQTPAVNPTH